MRRTVMRLLRLCWPLPPGMQTVVAALLKAGADVRVPVPETGSVLSAAARTGNPEVIKLLLAAGADVNFADKYSGQTALMWAGAEGHVEAVKALLAGGAKVDQEAHDKKTALFFAVRKGDLDSVRTLIAAGANVNARTEPVDMPNCEICKIYPTGTKFSPFGDSMLVIAILNENFEVADLLLNKGADPNMAGTHWSPLHALIRIRNYEETQFPAPKGTGKLDSLEFAKHLLAHGANPSARAEGYTTQRSSGDQNYLEFKGATPFFLAVKAADLPMVHLLLDAKADYTTPTENHTTPLMVAAGVGCVTGQWIEPEHDVLETVKILVDRAACRRQRAKRCPRDGSARRGLPGTGFGSAIPGRQRSQAGREEHRWHDTARPGGGRHREARPDFGCSHREDWIFPSHRGPVEEVDG